MAILDAELPGDYAFDLVRTMRTTWPGLAVIMATSGRRPGDAARTRAAGAQGRLVKPYRIAELQGIIERALAVQTPAANVPPARPLQALSALIVDDDPINCKLTARLLEKCGVLPAQAADAEAALALLEQRRFEAVVTDVKLPGASGLELAGRIRARFGQGIVIVGVTGFDEQDWHERCLGAGMDACIANPVQAARLYQALDRLWAPATVGAATTTG
jgi:CheY-like chemotaxis protein